MQQPRKKAKQANVQNTVPYVHPNNVVEILSSQESEESRESDCVMLGTRPACSAPPQAAFLAYDGSGSTPNNPKMSQRPMQMTLGPHHVDSVSIKALNAIVRTNLGHGLADEDAIP